MTSDQDRALRTGKPYIVVSSDTHAAPDTFEEYLSYVEPKLRDDVAGYGPLQLGQAKPKWGGRPIEEKPDGDVVRAAVRRKAGGLGVDVDVAASWVERYTSETVIAGDGDGRRLELLEHEWIHAEVTYPNPHLAGALSPLMPDVTNVPPIDVPRLFWPALSAYNHWLADFCAAAPGRRAGVVQVSFDDMDRAVEEIRWARGAGLFGGVTLPAMRIGLPGYTDDYYEPLWNACVEHQMVLNLHTGPSAPDAHLLYDEKRGPLVGMYETYMFTRRPIWFLILGGVFDRHPELKLTIAEDGSHWLLSMIRDMELFFDTHAGASIRRTLQRRPRDYVQDHIFLGASQLQRYEVDMRDEIGIDKLMWGTDYPHLEGTTTVHRQAIQHVLGGLPEEDIRRIAGQNAIDLWGFDAGLLQSVADRVGPTVEDLSTQLPLQEIPNTFSWSLQVDGAERDREGGAALHRQRQTPARMVDA